MPHLEVSATVLYTTDSTGGSNSDNSLHCVFLSSNVCKNCSLMFHVDTIVYVLFYLSSLLFILLYLQSSWFLWLLFIVRFMFLYIIIVSLFLFFLALFLLCFYLPFPYYYFTSLLFLFYFVSKSVRKVSRWKVLW